MVKYLPVFVFGSIVIEGGIIVPTVISTDICASGILSPVVWYGLSYFDS